MQYLKFKNGKESAGGEKDEREKLTKHGRKNKKNYYLMKMNTSLRMSGLLKEEHFDDEWAGAE